MNRAKMTRTQEGSNDDTAGHEAVSAPRMIRPSMMQEKPRAPSPNAFGRVLRSVYSTREHPSRRTRFSSIHLFHVQPANECSVRALLSRPKIHPMSKYRSRLRGFLRPPIVRFAPRVPSARLGVRVIALSCHLHRLASVLPMRKLIASRTSEMPLQER